MMCAIDEPSAASRVAADGNPIEIVPDRLGAPFLDQGFSGLVAEGGQGLRPVPGEGLLG